jgi:hypothetical protein
LAVNDQLVSRSPADELLERLDDPRVATSLTYILDHADLLAVLVAGIHGFVERGDEIAEAVADGVRELRVAAPGAAELGPVDVAGLLSSLATLSNGVVGATPTLNSLLALSADPRLGSTITMLGEALVEGGEEAAKSPAAPTGVFGLLRVLKDDEVSRGLGLLIQIAKALGRKLS